MGAPEGLGERGSALWAALGRAQDSPSGALALEACRIADRLDDLDRIVRGKGVVNLLTFRLQHAFTDEGGDRNVSVTVEFSNVLAEARQQQMALKQVLVSLGLDEAAPVDDGKVSPLAQVLALVSNAKPAGGSAG